MFLRCLFRCFFEWFCLWILNGFGSTFDRYLDIFFVFFGKRKYVKTSTASARELDFQGWEGFGSV